VLAANEEEGMATRERRFGPGGGLTLGGIIVVLGILLLIFWSFWIGLIITLVGLIFFGGFARGRWY
jgi:hypothetical protein